MNFNKVIHTNKGLINLWDDSRNFGSPLIGVDWASKSDEFVETPLLAIRIANSDPFADYFIPLDRISPFVRNPALPLKYIHYTPNESGIIQFHHIHQPVYANVTWIEIDDTFEDIFIPLFI